MTCVLLGGIRDGDIRHDVSGGDAAATPILDWGHHDVARLYEDIAEGAIQSAQEFLVSAHRSVAATIRAVYGLDDRQPVSVTLSRGRGSCSQRLAVVEALARRRGIATRVRGLVLRGEFWYPRFRHLRAVIPKSVLLAWPEFLIDGRWQDISEIVAPAAVSSVQPFTNTGEETLFDAIGRAPISWVDRFRVIAWTSPSSSTVIWAPSNRATIFSRSLDRRCRPPSEFSSIRFSGTGVHPADARREV